jgi:uncharacterized protein (TIGR03382 family)
MPQKSASRVAGSWQARAVRFAFPITLALALAGCPDKDPYNSAMQGNASCVIHDGKGTRCHEYTWYSPSDRTSLAAVCIGPESTFDDDARCPDGAVSICVTSGVSTHIYDDYTEIEKFDADCVDSGGTIEEAGCSAARSGAIALPLAALALLVRRRRRRPE